MSPRVTPLDVHIAQRLKLLRAARKMTQPTVAGFLGITYQSYQKMESGRVSFRVSTLARLSELFGVSLIDIMGGQPLRTAKNASETAHVTSLMTKMPSKAARAVLDHVLATREAPAQ